MSPIQYHNTVAALIESQRMLLEGYERQIAEMKEQVAKLQAELDAKKNAEG